MDHDFQNPMITDRIPGDVNEVPLQILTSGGLLIPVQPSILSSASPVLASITNQSEINQSSQRIIRVFGVPCKAVSLFVQFLISEHCSEEEMENYGIHLLALSHVYMIPNLKQRCSKALADSLSSENVIDRLQLARLCDAPHLYLKCMKLSYTNFKAVENTEAWKFIQNHDPWLELQILQFIDDVDMRKKRAKRRKEEQSLYLLLSEAMECLEHICTEGCTNVAPYDVKSDKKKLPCSKFSTCQGLQLSIRHFATCKQRVNRRCVRCKRIWQILRLHSEICDQPDTCKVPVCRQFKLKTQNQKEKNGENEGRWNLLVKKVKSAQISSSLSISKKVEILI